MMIGVSKKPIAEVAMLLPAPLIVFTRMRVKSERCGTPVVSVTFAASPRACA
jgi:hypothetical protein